MKKVAYCILFILLSLTPKLAYGHSSKNEARKSMKATQRQQKKAEKKAQRNMKKSMKSWKKAHNAGH